MAEVSPREFLIPGTGSKTPGPGGGGGGAETGLLVGEGRPCRWEQVPQGRGSASKWGSAQCCARSAFSDCILVPFAELKEAMTESHLLRAWRGEGPTRSRLLPVLSLELNQLLLERAQLS